MWVSSGTMSTIVRLGFREGTVERAAVRPVKDTVSDSTNYNGSVPTYWNLFASRWATSTAHPWGTLQFSLDGTGVTGTNVGLKTRFIVWQMNGNTPGTKIYDQARTGTHSNWQSISTFSVPGLQVATEYLVYAFLGETSDNYYDHLYCARVVTQRNPTQPTVTGPPSGLTYPYAAGKVFDYTWQRNDPDVPDPIATPLNDYSGWEVQYREAPSSERPDPAWTTGTSVVYPNNGSANPQASTVEVWAGPGSQIGRVYIPNPGSYQIRVRTRDRRLQASGSTWINHGEWSPWSSAISFTLFAPTLPPLPNQPSGGVAVQAGGEIGFFWYYRDPRPSGGSQVGREIRLRKVGDATWTDVIPPADRPSSAETYSWTPPGELEPGRYEWQVRTEASPGGLVSNWSESAFFYIVPPPGSGPVVTFPDGEDLPSLGCGEYRVLVCDRGGKVVRGELTDMTRIEWSRERDEMSDARITIRDWDADCGALLSSLHSWMHEIVIYRDSGYGPSDRVWEGPITRIAWTKDQVTIQANDVMAYPYRRILRHGYNDAYRPNGGGLTRVTLRALSILQNCLAYDDPNVLQYIRAIVRDNDARQSRVVPDFASTAYEEVDDLAASAGLDYTVIGRSIVLFDVDTEIGKLPEFVDGYFDNSPVVTEYGMQLANVYAISNNNGVYGIADRLVNGEAEYYGFVEMIDSAYGESDEAGDTETLTEAAKERLREALTGQAERAIASRWPTPVVVRVPDNSTLSPEVPVGINQLVPGVRIPLRSDATLRKLAQLQKLDSLKVVADEDGEKVKITMSPAKVDFGVEPE